MKNEIKNSGMKFETKEADDGSLLVSGYIGTFRTTPDSYNDIVMPGAYTKTIRERRNDIKFLHNHNSDFVLGGSFRDIYEDSKGCIVEDAKIVPTSYGKDISMLITAEALSTFSIGYSTIKKAYDGDVRKIVEMKLYEFSIVPFPADEDARMLGFKGRIRNVNDVEDILHLMISLKGEMKEGRKPSEDIMIRIQELKKLMDEFGCEDQPMKDPEKDITVEEQPVDYSGIESLIKDNKKLLDETVANMKKLKGV